MKRRHSLLAQIAATVKHSTEGFAQDVAEIRYLEKTGTNTQINRDECDENHRPGTPHQITDPSDERQEGVMHSCSPKTAHKGFGFIILPHADHRQYNRLKAISIATPHEGSP